MADVDSFTRNYFFVDAPGPATSESVADLLEAAATALRARGEVTVHHVVFESADDAAALATTLFVYYDRVERRRTARDR